MKPLITHKGLVVPLDRENIDTDAILPKQFLKRVKKTGYENYLFYNWRFLDNNIENPEFIFNQDRYKSATILLTKKNFGCGSSREHAVWALENYGIKIIIAPSFGGIFYNNCFINGVLPIQLNNEDIQQLFDNSESFEKYQLFIDVENKVISDEKEFFSHFELNDYRQKMLLHGFDEIEMTLQKEVDIESFETKHEVFYNF